MYSSRNLDYSNIVPVIRDLALKAGNEIMQVYGSEDFGVDTKSDNSPVTRADRAADAIISAGLKATFPNIALVTEEQSDTHEVTATTFFIVDPLDGTKEFIKRRGEFTVNIALVENGVPTLGDAARKSADHDRFVAHVDHQIERVIVLGAGHALGPIPRTAARDAGKHRIRAAREDCRLRAEGSAGTQ